jgi:hypothetical protein
MLRIVKYVSKNHFRQLFKSTSDKKEQTLRNTKAEQDTSEKQKPKRQTNEQTKKRKKTNPPPQKII